VVETGRPLRLLPSNPKANWLAHRNEIDRAIDRVLRSGHYVLGKQVAAFENEFAGYIGVRFGIGVGNGTDALHLALRACGVGEGDQVITVSHTAVATVAAIELCGAEPVFVDIDPGTYTIDPKMVEQAITKCTKAIIPVHLYGQPADMGSITSIASDHQLHVVEDCAQSHGASYKGRKTGAWGDVAAFSFYPTKNLGALGDGGMVVTDDAGIAERVRLLREYGWRNRYVSEIPGMNSRLDEVQAAILRVKLRHLDKENRKRQSLARTYEGRLRSTSLVLPTCASDSTHAYHQYVVRHRNRDSLRKFLAGKGINTLIHYPVPVHQQPAYRGRLRVVGSMINTEKVANEILSLPMYPELRQTDARRVAEAIVSWDQSGEA